MNNIPPHAICVFTDGNQWCAVFGDFINIQESPCGFASSFFDSILELKKQLSTSANQPSTESKTNEQ